MRAWVDAFPLTRELFDEIEIWASECEVPEGRGVTWRRIPRRMPVWTLHAIDFQRRVARMASNQPASVDRIIQVTGCLVSKADIRYIHYWNSALLEEQKLRSQTFPLPWSKRFPAHLAAKKERDAMVMATPAGMWWVVSRALAERIKSSGARGSFEILPNQYDPTRFNSSVRKEWRDRMRNQYGFQPDERVLAFSAFGHFERKGLRQGVEAVEKLRQLGHPVKFLIVGGSPATVEAFRNSLNPEQRNACVFAGLVDGIERHLAAADGFLFPSHFEAFSLAEIEAAALGLRLYLTPHYGSEMILREPDNGRLLPWEPSGMAAVIEKDIMDGSLGRPHDVMAEALTPETYGQRLRTLYQGAIDRKAGLNS